ncbi:hypothetical protein SARC_18059, partial [Sphaeroforma arctica JP610]
VYTSHERFSLLVYSRPVEWLFNVISKYSSEEQRKFLQFVTGAPQLPVGGLAALTPPLTVVRVRSDVDTCDSLLPSVMTCQNYFKLPGECVVEHVRVL